LDFGVVVVVVVFGLPVGGWEVEGVEDGGVGAEGIAAIQFDSFLMVVV
jgi:hypothetical protein